MSEGKANNPPHAKLSPFAANDLRETWLYISDDNREYADKTVDEIMAKCEFIALSPKIGKLRSDLVSNLRLFPFKHFNIYYFQTEFGIEIYRILHSSRDTVQIFDDTIDETD